MRNKILQFVLMVSIFTFASTGNLLASPYYGWISEETVDPNTLGLWHWNASDGNAVNAVSGELQLERHGTMSYAVNGGKFGNGANCPGGTTGTDNWKIATSGGGLSGYDMDSIGTDPSLSVAVWIKPNVLPTASSPRQVIFDKAYSNTPTAGYEMYLWYWNGTIYLKTAIGTVGGANVATSTAITLVSGQWTHLAMTWNAKDDTLRVYKDGVLFASTVSSGKIYAPSIQGSTNAQLLYVGQRVGATYGTFSGVLDDLKISDVAVEYRSPSVAIAAGDYKENGVFLAHNYVVYQSWVNEVNTVSSAVGITRKCNYWFVNVGLLNSSGLITSPSTQLAKVREFLNAVKAYETANGCQFKVIASINAAKANENLSSSSLRSAIVGECKKFVSSSEPNSYVSGANRVFDGISMDIEPCGNDDTYFDNYKTLMDEIRTAFDYLGLYNTTTSVCTPGYGSRSSQWQWDAVYYYYMARHVNFLTAMTYDSGSTSASAYQTWISNQTYNILRAVSGRYWSNDVNHPAPANGVKVFIGFPAYPASSNHNPAYENTQYAANGTLNGLNNLLAVPDHSVDYFQGGFVFSHTDGTGNDGRASWAYDWWWWGHYWLAIW